MANRDSGRSLHVAVLPWLAAGHITPFFELSVRIAGLGSSLRVSFLSTPPILLRLGTKTLPPNLSLVPLTPSFDSPISSTSELTESTEDVLRPLLRRSFDSLSAPFATFLSSNTDVDWVLCDYAAYWAPPIARSLAVKSCYLSIFFACSMAFMGPPAEIFSPTRLPPHDLVVPPKWVPFPTTVAFRPHEVANMARNRVVDDFGVSEMIRFGITLRDVDICAYRTCYEFEEEWVRVLEDIYGKPVIPVGHYPAKDVSFRQDLSKFDGLFSWLDSQAENSVVYVAFGSEVRLTKEQVQAIAHGLELSNLPFIWALIWPQGLDDVLPEGFLGRTEGRGVVFQGWVPQLKILGHPAMGGFMTHCGCSSITEGLNFGLGLILVPMIFDQMFNARMLEEKKFGKEVPRDEDTGAFAGEGIAETLRLVMVEEDGKVFREKCREFKKIIGDEKLQDSYIEKFVKYLEGNKSK